MDEFSRSRKSSSGLFLSKKGSGLSLRDPSTNSDQSTPVCSRVGCSSRISSPNRSNIGFSNKAKSIKQPFQLSSSGKEILGSSSKLCPPSNGQRKSGSDRRRKLPYQQATSLKSSNLQDESHLSEQAFTPDNSQTTHVSLPQNQVPRESFIQEASSSSSTSYSRNSRNTSGKHEPSDHTSTFGPCSTSIAYRSGVHGSRSGPGTSRYSFKNLNRNTTGDVGPSGCSSSSVLGLGGRRELGRKRNNEAESSCSAGGKKVSGPQLDDRKADVSHRGGISISDSRRTRNLVTSGRDNNSSNGVRASVRAPRSTTRARLMEPENRTRFQHTDASVLHPLLSLTDIPLTANGSSLNCQFPAQSTSNSTNSSGQPSSGSESMHSGRMITPFGIESGRSFTNRENLRIYNLDGIAEMLLALDRIEHDEELSYEQLLILETNLFLGGLSFHDRHRDMRLDIDNMSYEELLALEERMGTVSTALTEGELEKCLERSIFQGSLILGGEAEDDIKCSICQEEYSDGDEVGRLGCEHGYHVECISQWLRLKNWCPVCKTSAQLLESSSSAPPPPPSASPF